MAGKVQVTAPKEAMPEKEAPEIPLLNLSDAAVTALIRSAKKRGYVTHDQVHALLSTEERQVRADREHPGEVQ
jgi:RNA polymerase primary sigma factor